MHCGLHRRTAQSLARSPICRGAAGRPEWPGVVGRPVAGLGGELWKMTLMMFLASTCFNGKGNSKRTKVLLILNTSIAPQALIVLRFKETTSER